MPTKLENSATRGRGILKPRSGSNIVLIEAIPNPEAECSRMDGNKLIVPDGAGAIITIQHPSDGKPGTVYDVRVFRAQEFPYHKPGCVVFNRNPDANGRVEINLGPGSGRIEHPVLGRVEYVLLSGKINHN